jgi:type I restriction enzyme S subunit
MSKVWPLVPLGDVLKERQETPSSEDLASGRVRIVSKIGFKEGKIELRDEGDTKTKMILIQPGDLVVSGINAAKGAIAIYGEENGGPAAATIHYGSYIPDKKKVDIRYLWWLLRSQTFRDILLQHVPGGIKTELKAKRLLPVPVPLPLLEEQHRIVARIEELEININEAIDLRYQSIAGVEALTLAISLRLFEPKPDWQIMRVDDFCDPPQYGYTESATAEPIGPRFLRITDIQDGRVNWDKVPYCRCPEPEKYLLKPNDLVFARTGATTGKSFVIRDCPEAVFASYLIRLRVCSSISVDYLYWYFQSPLYWAQVEDQKKGTGQPNLNGSKLRNLTVPVAPPLEQKHIVAELEALQRQVDELKIFQAETSNELNALLPSILDRAFKGEL